MSESRFGIRGEVSVTGGDELDKLSEGAKKLGSEAKTASGDVDKLEQETEQLGQAASSAAGGVERSAQATRRSGAAANAASGAKRGLFGVLRQIATSAGSAATAVGSRLTSAYYRATGAARAFTAGIREQVASLGGLKTAIAALGFAGFAQQMRSALGTISEFSGQMGAVQSILQASVKDFDALVERAKALGSTTQFSATQAAEAMENLARAGFDVNETYEGVEGVLELAAAGGLDLGQAAEIASDALRGMGLPVSELGRVVDNLAAGSAKSATTVSQLGEGLAKVAPVAAALGIPLEQVIATLGTFANAGIKGEEGGTALRNMLLNLVEPTAGAKRALSELGLSLEDVNPEANGLIPVIEKLAVAGIDAGQAYEIFGKRGVASILAAAGATGPLRELQKALEDSAGAAGEMAELRLDNLEGDVTNLKSAWEGVTLEVGEGATPALRAFVQDLTGGLRRGGNAAFELGRALGTIVLAIGGTVAAVRTGASVITGAIKALVGGVLTAVGAGVEQLGKLIGQVPGLEDLGTNVEQVAASIKESFQGAAKEGIDLIVESSKEGKESLERFGDALAETWTQNRDATTGAMRDIQEGQNDLTRGVEDGVDQIRSLWDGLTESQKEAGESARKAILDALGVDEMLEDKAAAAEALLQRLSDNYTAILQLPIEKQRALGEVVQEQVQIIQDAGGVITQEVANLNNALGNELVTPTDGATTAMTRLQGSVRAAADGLLSAGTAASDMGASMDGAGGGTVTLKNEIEQLGTQAQTTAEQVEDAAQRVSDSSSKVEESGAAVERAAENYIKLEDGTKHLIPTVEEAAQAIQQGADATSEAANQLEAAANRGGEAGKDLADGSKAAADEAAKAAEEGKRAADEAAKAKEESDRAGDAAEGALAAAEEELDRVQTLIGETKAAGEELQATLTGLGLPDTLRTQVGELRGDLVDLEGQAPKLEEAIGSAIERGVERGRTAIGLARTELAGLLEDLQRLDAEVADVDLSDSDTAEAA
ncbi:MAG: phage tail tape measure protein [Acidobacteriota bacterium]